MKDEWVGQSHQSIHPAFNFQPATFNQGVTNDYSNKEIDLQPT